MKLRRMFLGGGMQVSQLTVGMFMGLESAKTMLSENVNERIKKVDNFPDEYSTCNSKGNDMFLVSSCLMHIQFRETS